MNAHVSFLPAEATHGLGSREIHHPPGTFALTPASLIAVEAIGRHQTRFRGVGLDWGSGSGILAIAAARIPHVDVVVGLELVEANVHIARRNAERNGVQGKVSFFRSDSYRALEPQGENAIAALEGAVDFILANPPSSSPSDDGFEFRRMVMREAGRFLKPGGIVCLSVSRQYGTSRVMGLLDLDPTLNYAGVLSSTEWVPFDMNRDDLRRDVETYAEEERRGGLRYSFRHPSSPARKLSAVDALAHHGRTGESPLSRWQSHLFVRRTESGQP